MRPGLRRIAGLALLLAAAGGCARCGKAGTAAGTLTRALPKDGEAMVWVPDLTVLGRKLAIVQGLKLASFVAQLQGAGSAEEYVSTVMAQAGVDVRSPEALRKAGIDPARGLAVAVLAGDRGYTALGVEDAGRLEATVARLARDRLSATVVQRGSADGITTVQYSRAAGAPPELALALRGGVAFLAAGASAPSVAAYAALRPEQSLAEDAPFLAALQRLPAARDVVVHLPATSAAGARAQAAGATFTGALSAEGLTLRADLPWASTRRVLDALKRQEGPDLFGLLPPDAFAVARLSGDPVVLDQVWPYLAGPRLEQAIREAGFNVREVLENLKPGTVLALALAPTVKLGAGVPSLDVRRTNPFRFVHLVAAGQVKDAAKAQQVLEAVPALAPRLGAAVTPADRAGQRVFLTTYAQGEGAHLALKGDDVFLAGPEPRLLEALARVGQPPGPPPYDPSLGGVFAGNGVAAVVDLRRLVDSVKALPSEAWGVGGFAIKATTLRWLEATDDLRALTLGLSARDSAIQAELSLRLAPAAGGGAAPAAGQAGP